jgi:hypothetical protein
MFFLPRCFLEFYGGPPAEDIPLTGLEFVEPRGIVAHDAVGVA